MSSLEYACYCKQADIHFLVGREASALGKGDKGEQMPKNLWQHLKIANRVKRQTKRSCAQTDKIFSQARMSSRATLNLTALKTSHPVREQAKTHQNE